MNERNNKRDELFEQFGNRQLPDELKREVESSDDLKREWEELQALQSALPTEEDFAISEAELDALCAAVDDKIYSSNVTPLPVSRRLSPVWQRSIALAATLALVVISSLMFNRYQPEEQAASIDVSSELISDVSTDEAVDLTDPMYNALILNYTNRVDVEPASMLLDDLTEEEFEFLNENFNVDELML